MQYKIILFSHFGMEAVLKREVLNLGYETLFVEDGRVCFLGDERAIVRANIFLRTAKKVMILLDEFPAESFEELFNGVYSIPFEDYLPSNANFPVAKASFINSSLISSKDIQSITKKAIVKRLEKHYRISWFSEDGAKYPIRVFIKDNKASIYLDTTGEPLHKRGYKKRISKAPIAETLAAALIMLTPYREDRIFLDPFCGTGTFAIEAALIAKNIAPGINRRFQSMDWNNFIQEKLWQEGIKEGRSLIKNDINPRIYGYDIDSVNIGNAKANAASANVEGSIHYKTCDIRNASKDFYKYKDEYGFIVTNPPYGNRLTDTKLGELYGELGKLSNTLDTWSLYFISAYNEAIKAVGKKPSKNRKIYNGMIKSYFYQYPGPKPVNRK